MANYDKYSFITELDKNEIFVFGSNGQGTHLGGATATNQNTSGGGSHENRQPYITVYMWKRTA